MIAKTDWTRKDLIGIEDLSREEIEFIFDKAKVFKRHINNIPPELQTLTGKTVVNLFMEPSTRTRVAFEVAASRLNGNIITITGESSSLVKGESLRDTAKNIEALSADIIVVRHKAAGSPLYLSEIVDIPVINAGDGSHEHPTQALLDTFTLIEKWGSLEGKKITILGDILFSRVARSNILALKKLGAEVTISGPSTLVPKSFECYDVTVTHRLKDALADADALMLLRIQHERRTSTHFPSLGEYTSMFGLNKQRASWLKSDALIMHPGPINRGVEIDSNLANSKHSVILDQVANGIAIRMATLDLCTKVHQSTATPTVTPIAS